MFAVNINLSDYIHSLAIFFRFFPPFTSIDICNEELVEEGNWLLCGSYRFSF